MNPDDCAWATEGVDYVFRQAAIPSVPRSVADPLTTHAACATGTLNVLVAARNAIRANLLACEAPVEAVGKVFNVGCGERLSVNELWRKIRALVGADQDATYAPSRAGDVRDSLASLDLGGKLLGYKPLVSLDEGLSLTLEFFTAALVPR